MRPELRCNMEPQPSADVEAASLAAARAVERVRNGDTSPAAVIALTRASDALGAALKAADTAVVDRLVAETAPLAPSAPSLSPAEAEALRHALGNGHGTKPVENVLDAPVEPASDDEPEPEP